MAKQRKMSKAEFERLWAEREVLCERLRQIEEAIEAGGRTEDMFDRALRD